jgi:hypothetical protein
MAAPISEATMRRCADGLDEALASSSVKSGDGAESRNYVAFD